MSLTFENDQEDVSAGENLKVSPGSLSDTMSNDFLVYAARLWEARRFILSTTVIGGLLSVILAIMQPKQYESTTSLMPPNNRSASESSLLASMAAGPLAAAGSNALGLQTKGALYEKVLESRTVQDNLINQFDLRKVYHTVTYNDTRLRLAANTQISDDRKSGVITITVKASSPQLAAELAKGYVDELNTLMAQLDMSSAHREREFLEHRLKDVEADLENDATQLGQFSSKNTVVAGEDQSRAIMTAVETLRGQTIIAKADLAALQAAYSPGNERVRAAQAKFDELQRELAQMRGSGAPGAEDVDGFPSIRALPLLGVKYADIYRHLAVQTSIFEALTKQYEMAKVEEARDIPTVRVLDAADVPEKKSHSMRTLMVLSGTVLAFLLACGCILMQGWWKSSNSPWRRLVEEIAAAVITDISHVPGVGRLVRSLHAPSQTSEY
jgi:uncharacterized protein involved in exopolysaccharide biosynthesis